MFPLSMTPDYGPSIADSKLKLPTPHAVRRNEFQLDGGKPRRDLTA